MGMPPPHFRSEQALPWYCKSCVGPAGRPWWNHADAGQCAKCKLGKGLVFNGHCISATPSKRKQKPQGDLGRYGYWLDSVQVAKLNISYAGVPGARVPGRHTLLDYPNCFCHRNS